MQSTAEEVNKTSSGVMKKMRFERPYIYHSEEVSACGCQNFSPEFLFRMLQGKKKHLKQPLVSAGTRYNRCLLKKRCYLQPLFFSKRRAKFSAFLWQHNQPPLGWKKFFLLQINRKKKSRSHFPKFWAVWEFHHKMQVGGHNVPPPLLVGIGLRALSHIDYWETGRWFSVCCIRQNMTCLVRWRGFFFCNRFLHFVKKNHLILRTTQRPHFDVKV